jgi:hypothetical protein
MAMMKSFVLVALSIIFVSIACTAYKSSGSQTISTNNTQAPINAQTNNATAREKTPCTLTLAGAPDIKGLRLGMTLDQVLALFPGSEDDAEVRMSLSKPPSQLGSSSFLIKPEKYGSKDTFTGTSQIAFALLDGRVLNFTVSYNGPQFSHVDKFVAKFVEGTNLPPVDQWAPYVGMDNQLKILKCAEFEVRVFAGGQGGNLNYVSVKDLVADKKLQERRKKASEQATPTPG